MRQSLSLTLRQQLAITPELKQSLRLLQISSLELCNEIQQALETNPMLELASDLDELETGNSREASEAPETEAQGVSEEMDLDEAFGRDSLPQELPVDSVWEDTWLDAAPRQSGSRDLPDNLSGYAEPGTLTDDLLWQLETGRVPKKDHMIARAIIYSINEDGWLTEPLESVVEGVEEQPVSMSRALTVLKAIQRFDPTGVGARVLGECLCIQLEELPESHPDRQTALKLVARHLPQLARPNIAELARQAKCEEQEVASALALIQSLDPRPGHSLRRQRETYVVPDVAVRKREGAWRVELNPDAWPSVAINPLYSNMIRRGDTTGDNQYLREKLGEAKWFLRGLRGRGETLLRVASEIVARQRAFLEHGAEAMKPLVLQEVADVLGLHESTISRVTSNKFMQTPHGVFELKYFFPRALIAKDGSDVSSVAIRARMRKLVGEENPHRPLSDSTIVELLAKEGIRLARRTVAKYRKGMAIPSSSARKVH